MKKTKTPVQKSAARKSAPKKAAPRKSPRAKTPPNPLRARVENVRAILDAKKGENVVVLHVANVSSVADYLVLCSGLNVPHLRALADEVAKQLRLESPPVAPYRRAGSAESEWYVLDYVDFVVHLFTPQMRAYYALEQLWKDAPVVS
ncbi:MAG: ribosome silencing factor [Kiritimatiellia bacterium]